MTQNQRGFFLRGVFCRTHRNMFNEDEDWNDEREAQILSKTVLSNTKKADSGASVKLKVVGKNSLMRTLKTLGSVPEWKSESHQQGSDEDTEEATPQSKKKKKRRKKRKHTEEQQEIGDQSLKEEKSAPKKRKRDDKVGSANAKSTSSGEGMDKEMTTSALVNVKNPQSTERLSRKQWKNKMKNKRKCKNKYSQKKPEEEVNKAKSTGKHEPKEEVNDLHSNNKSEKNSQKKDRKPLKKKHTEEEANEKHTKCIPVQKSAPDSSADGSEQQTCERAVEVTVNQQHFPTKRLKPEQSKAQSLKRQKLQRMLHSQETEHHESPAEHHESPAEPKEKPAEEEEEVKQDRSASLRCRMEQRLEAARFRYINEVLYSTSSGEAKRMFKQDPQAFWIYHRGYTAQVQRWPANPVDAIISYIQKRSSSLVVADFGCGDCKIARSVKNRVHSFDLASTCELVTVCDMAHVPLDDGSVDIAVFCLSLMGTNLADFLAEANRVLKMQGVLKIAEVASRFDNARNFISALSTLGFKMVSKDTENSHFYSFEFVKTKKAPENIKKAGLQLKPCVYKKR